MKVFSTHRKKLEPKRRFGSREFRTKVKAAANYKRVFAAYTSSSWEKFWRRIGLGSSLLRWLGLAVIIIIFYFLVLSPALVVSNIEVSGNAQISTQQIQDVINHEGGARFFLIKKADYFLMTQGRVSKMLTGNLPTIKAITAFKRIWPNTIQITVKERTPGFALKSNNNLFLVDDEGTVVKSLDDPEGLPIVEDSVVEDFSSGESLANAKIAQFILSMAKAWPSKFTTPITAIKFPGQASNEVQFTSAEGWTVFFDINRSATSELADLALLFAQQIPAKDRANLAYVDMRLSKFTYICFNDKPCHQQPDTTPVPDATAITPSAPQ